MPRRASTLLPSAHFPSARDWFARRTGSLYWPDLASLRVALEVAYRHVTAGAAVQLIRFRWARWEIGPWLLSVSLLLLHLEWPALRIHSRRNVICWWICFLGLSMLLMVFDDSRVRTRRLGVINALTTTIARSQQHGPMMQTALEELKNVNGGEGSLVPFARRRQTCAHQATLVFRRNSEGRGRASSRTNRSEGV